MADINVQERESEHMKDGNGSHGLEEKGAEGKAEYRATVGILSIGDMGVGIGGLLRANGYRVVTVVEGRRYVAFLTFVLSAAFYHICDFNSCSPSVWRGSAVRLSKIFLC
jgi:hypothetical protein